MTILLSLILIVLIVLVILAVIGVFNIKDICNCCDFIQGIQYHKQGTLNSINSTLSQIIINQEDMLSNINFNTNKINITNQLLEDIKDNTAYEPDDFITDDDWPFPEDDGKTDAPIVVDELAEKAETVAEAVVPVIEDAGGMLRAIRDGKLNECVCVDCSDTPEKASEDIPDSLVESDDTTEDKGEADA